MFRSEEMECYRVILPKAAVYNCLSAVGEYDLIEIISNCSPDEEKPFVFEIQFLKELDQKLIKMVKDIKNMEMLAETPNPIPKTPPLNELLFIGSDRKTSLNTFYKINQEYEEISEYCQIMKDLLVQMVEKHRALLLSHKFMLEMEDSERVQNSRFINEFEDKHKHLSQEEIQKILRSLPVHSRFLILTGVIPWEKSSTIEVLIWRFMQGNAVVRLFDSEPQTRDGRYVEKRVKVILVSVQGMKSALKIHKLLQGYFVRLHPMSWDKNERSFVLNRTLDRIFSLRGALNEANEHRLVLLRFAAHHCKKWFIEIEKMRATYMMLNTMDWTSMEQYAVMMFWVPKIYKDRTVKILLETTKALGINNPIAFKVVELDTAPPTYFKPNKFTRAFQNIIDAYGVPSYREMNPMPFTVITFPFLFAIMFGDMGHGLIMLSFAVTIIIMENKIQSKRINNEIFNLMFDGRYIILLMGMFSLWTGLIYNDFLSIGFGLGSSHWTIDGLSLEEISSKEVVTLDVEAQFNGAPYPVGMDPIWKLAHNDIKLTNAIKMKVAIIFGVSQMAFGIILNLFNLVYFHNILGIFVEFIPQVIFFTSLFIYLVVLFFIKWVIYDAKGPPSLQPRCAPSVLITFINMMMFSYHPNEDPTCQTDLYPYQGQVQSFLVLIAFSSVPVLLLVEPTVAIVKMKTKGVESKSEDDSIMSIIVHQFILTIEFCLGTVSYTASYLRLWALSLAHYQLSSVLWNMVLILALPGSHIAIQVVAVVISFFIFAILTVAILVVIEGLSAFLHALRLHWMEFQSKFFVGLGYYFVPFSYKHILKGAKVPVEGI